MKRRILISATVSGVVGLLAGCELQTFLSIDRCLDARGRWDHQRSICEGVVPGEW